jgi:hypothetical protein
MLGAKVFFNHLFQRLRQLEITQELTDVENSLRDFITAQLSAKFGKDWINFCGISEDRIKTWKERQTVEQKRQRSGSADTRLIYYSDFYDLRTILKKHWSLFTEALGDWRTIEVFLSELENLRDPDAHRRGLMPHQNNLILGISGEIRNRLIRYRSKQETGEDYYPRIESVSDNLGNFWSPSIGTGNHLETEMKLRPGDILEFIVTARDPLGESLEYNMNLGHGPWQDSPEFRRIITEKDVGSEFAVFLCIRSHRKFHSWKDIDHCVGFHYTVLPPKIEK